MRAVKQISAPVYASRRSQHARHWSRTIAGVCTQERAQSARGTQSNRPHNQRVVFQHHSRVVGAVDGRCCMRPADFTPHEQNTAAIRPISSAARSGIVLNSPEQHRSSARIATHAAISLRWQHVKHMDDKHAHTRQYRRSTKYTRTCTLAQHAHKHAPDIDATLTEFAAASNLQRVCTSVC